MALAITSTLTHVTAPVDYVLMKGLLSSARKRLPFFNGSLPGQLMKNSGSFSVEWERIANLAVATTPLTQATGTLAFGNGRTAVNPVVSRLTVATAKYGNAIITNEEVDLMQVNVRNAKLMDKLGMNAGESLNELMIDVYQAGLNTATGASQNKRYASAVTTITSIVKAITQMDIKFAVNLINRRSGMKFTSLGTGSTNVGSSPIRDSYFGICHPDVEEDLRALGSGVFIGVEQYAGYMSPEVGEIGTVNGVRWCVSELAGVITADAGGNASTNAIRFTTTKTACDLYDTFIYGKECVGTVGLGENHSEQTYKMGDRVPAIQLIQKAVGSSGVGDMFNEVGSIAWKSWFAAKVLNPLWGVRIRTGSSRLTT